MLVEQSAILVMFAQGELDTSVKSFSVGLAVALVRQSPTGNLLRSAMLAILPSAYLEESRIARPTVVMTR